VDAEAETAALRAQLAAAQQREQELAAERERAAAERAAAIQKRIEEFTLLAVGTADTALAIGQEHRRLSLIPVTTDLFGDRVGEAITAQDNALQTLYEWHAIAFEREEAELRAAQAARVQELIDAIRGAGDTALLAVQDGSADVEQLETNLVELESTYNTPELFGDRQVEAGEVLAEAKRKTREAIAATQERDRLAAEEAERKRIADAEEAERQRLADAEQAQARAKYERTLQRLPELYLLLKVLAPALSADEHTEEVWTAQTRALALIAEIEGEDHA
jgi:hypothetical protein